MSGHLEQRDIYPQSYPASQHVLYPLQNLHTKQISLLLFNCDCVRDVLRPVSFVEIESPRAGII